MKKSFLFLPLFVLLLASCGKDPIQQGEIEYEITYPYSELNGIMDVMLPKKMTAIFKGDKMIASIEKPRIFKTDIYSESTTKVLKMRLDFGSDDIEATLSPEDLTNLQSTQTTYNVGDPIKTDTVAGLEATFYSVMNTNDDIGQFECAFSNDLSIVDTEWFTSYKGSQGVPLIYVVERYGIIMHLRATRFKSREVDDAEFAVGSQFKSISYKKYEKKVNELFELIIEE